MSNTLQGFFASDFSKLESPVMTFPFEAATIPTDTVRDVVHFSMPSDRGSS